MIQQFNSRYLPTISGSGDLERYSYVHNHNSAFHKNSEGEITQMYINQWMNKWNAVYPYSFMWFNNKKKWSIDTGFSWGESGRHYAKWNKPVTKKTNTVCFHLHELPGIAKSIDRKQRQVTRAGGGRNQELFFKSWVSVWKHGKDLEKKVVDIKVKVYNTP